MKCVFTTNDCSDTTYPLLKVAIKSLQQNTTLTPVVIWSGKDNTMTQWLKSRNVEIINHELSFKDKLKTFNFSKVDYSNKELGKMYNHYPDYYNENFILTESMRIDIPILFKDEEYIMYADCDVMFLDDVKIAPFTESLAVVVRNDFFNNGVMVMNIPKMLESYEDFKQFYLNSCYTFPIGNTTTQGAYNTYYNKVAKLPKELNWHCFWYINNEACIVHFCGPKPKDYERMLCNDLEISSKYDTLYKACLTTPAVYYITMWNDYADPRDRVDCFGKIP
jgi:hypothetical protein